MSISSINGVGAYSAVTAAETESKAAKAAETTDKQVKEDAAVFEKSQDTVDAAKKKMEDWKNGVTTAEDYSKYLNE